ncbi:MAG: response regulator transcription factor [Bacteroidetes bacterium]|nr:response regulator transcription factor [Bacteroidota bacterium]
MIKIIIADDHPAVRSAWSMFLKSQENIQILAECKNGRDAVKKTVELSPDIVLMDINMTDISGIEATKMIVNQIPEIKVIGVSFHTDPVYIERMIGAGARGYVFKHSVAEQLIQAINQVYNGKIFIAKEKV